jgi:hypothetical protein
MEKKIVIPKGVVAPKQERIVMFSPWTGDYLYLQQLVDNFYLDYLGLAIEPMDGQFWLYNTSICGFVSSSPIPPERVEYVKYDPEEELLLATETRLTIEEDVTFETFFRALRKTDLKVLLMPDDKGEYYAFELLYALPEDRFAQELSELLDSSPDAKSKILSIPVVDKKSGQQIEVEFIITELFDWIFVRLSAIKYQGTRVEYWIDKLNGKNVYTPDSEDILALKNCYVAFTRSSDYELDACVMLVDRLLFSEEKAQKRFRTTVKTFIGEMALRLRLLSYDFDEGEPVFNVEFDVFEPDYTVFLEQGV